jgi:putative adhesin Stv-like protein
MTKTLVVHGHGKWQIADGFVQTPRNVSVEYYTEGGKNQLTGFVYEYLLGSGMKLTGGSADLIIGPFRKTNNYTLKALSQKHYDSAIKYLAMGDLADNPLYYVHIMKPGARPVKLSTFMKLAEKKGFTKIVWLACRGVALKDEGGKKLGFGAAQKNRTTSIATLQSHMLELELNKIIREL